METKNIFITGPPGSGKTTLIKEISKELKFKIEIRGFFTEEIRKKGKRVGFKIVTLGGKEGILAKKGLKSKYYVLKYGVNLKDLEEIGVKEIEEALKRDCLLIIDEIGKMELCSEKFKETILRALDSKNKILGTILFKPHYFCDKIKQRKDTKIFDLSIQSPEEIKKEILKIL